MSRFHTAVSVLTGIAVATAGGALGATPRPAGAVANVTPSPHGTTDPGARAIEKHSFPTHEHGIDSPTGATYVDRPGLLAVAEPRSDGSALVLLRPRSEDVVGRMTVTGLTDPDTLADDDNGVLAALEGQTLLTWPASARGTIAARSRPVVGATISDPRGMTYDPTARRWLVLDGEGQRIVALDAEGATVRATSGPALADLGATELRGIALDTTSDQLYVADPSSEQVYVVSRTGEEQGVLDLSDMDAESLGSLAFGATADPTDGDTESSLYATDAGGPATYGRVAELSSTVGEPVVQAPLTSTATLVRRTLLSDLVPPSPDPSGIAYMSDLDRFLVVDSEVDEMSIYAGVNLWQLARDGSTVHDTANTRKFSNEPTGVGYDPARRRAFVSADGRNRIYEITEGADNRFGTSDDPVTYFSTSAFGNDDPEDVTYDTANGDLFVTQAVGAEVWRVSPGPNDRFDGVPPTGDDTVSHFDVGAFGVLDLEGIGYSPTRDSLFLADRKTTQVLEVSKTGALMQVIDVAGLEMTNPAAIALAPATDDPSRTSVYVVTRGVDNDKDPTENDGVMYEMSAPYLGPVGEVPNVAPSVDAGSDAAVVLPGQVALDGTVTDDGLPEPPGVTTVAWSTVSAPGTVTFADAGSVDTTATFERVGTYVLGLAASDSELAASDEVTVVVSSSAVTNLVGNPGFEVGMSGWKGSTGMEVVRVGDAHAGDWAAQVTNVGVGSASCQLNDSPNWVGMSGAGSYTASAWVKGDAAVAGSTARLRFREYVGKTSVGSGESAVTLTTDWQQVVLTYVPTSPGTSTLDFDVIRSSVRAGTLCFVADDISITSGAPDPEEETPNVAPSVDAGSDAAVVLPGQVALDGTVTDDGLPEPPGVTTVAWSTVSAPGTVTFADAGSVDTTATFERVGTYVLGLAASDSELAASDEVTVVVSSSAVTNLVGNPGFEVGMSGWKGSTGMEVVRVGDAHAGDWAAQVTNVGVGSASCQLNDSPNWVGMSGAGSYTASAWVKGDAAVAGSTARLRFREYVGKTSVGSGESAVTLTTDWQQVVLTYVPTSPGTSTLDFDVIRSSVRAGTLCFVADDISIARTP